MSTRLEIFKNDLWIELKLKDNDSIRYNTVINRIGSMSNREIKHSNTFELPYVHQNIQGLGINIFNKTDLAKSFNSKYVARYYIDDKLTQKGYLIINNTENGTISVNFIDEALQIIDSWGSINYYDLLNSTTLDIPTDYKDAINIMQDYVMSQTIILPSLGNVGSRGYGIAKFPNNLNAIGSKFQINAAEIRVDDAFNPYQSRPIFNVKALFDIAIETFGYTPIYDSSVDWDKLELTYMIDKDLSQSQKGDNSTIVKTYPKINSNPPAVWQHFSFYSYATLFVYPTEVNALYPVNLTPDWSISFFGTGRRDYQNTDKCILVPNTSVSFSGFMQWSGRSGVLVDKDSGHFVKAIWKKTGINNWIETTLTIDENNSSETLDPIQIFDIKVNKSQLSTLPVGTESLIGVVYYTTGISFSPPDTTQGMYDLTYTESFLPANTISYDQYDQYEAFNINLTHAAPRETVKDLISAVMAKEGILMSFNNELKTVKLFTYGSYITRKLENNFSDWSKYFQQYASANFNTDYGNEYAKKNEVGLMSPYKGNTIIVELQNQGTNSKYKDFTQNLSKKFKDVEAINFVQNTLIPYFEYTNKGLGLVELSTNTLSNLQQVRADGTNQGVIPNLTQVFNVNGLNLPNGLVEWYDLIDVSAKCEAEFLLPIREVKEVDMSEPIYVEGLGGFYIIEEIQEYVNEQTPVKVKLIKMIIPTIEITPPPVEDIFYDEAFYDNTYYD